MKTVKTLYRKLKPCPCCGSKAEVHDTLDHWDGVMHIYQVRCSKCGLMTAKFRTSKWAKEAWNRRDDNENA